jgi:uncharacterized protein YkwD
VRVIFPLVIVTAVVVAIVALAPRSRDARSASPCGAVDVLPTAENLELAGMATLCLINRERTSRGLPALASSDILARAELAHSQDMVQLGYFEHDSPDGRNVGDRLRAAGYVRRNASGGENIAWGAGKEGTPAAIVKAWMASPGHRADILRPAFREIGVGIAIGGPVEPATKGLTAVTYTTDFGGIFDEGLQAG